PVDYTLHFPGLESLAKAAGEAPPPSRGNVFYFEGNFTAARGYDRALDEEELRALVEAGVPAPETPVLTNLARVAAGVVEFLAWEPGRDSSSGGDAMVAMPAGPVTLDGPWAVEFEAGRGAPARIELPTLRSMHLHED